MSDNNNNNNNNSSNQTPKQQQQEGEETPNGDEVVKEEHPKTKRERLKGAFLRRFVRELPNEGSVARDGFASERTYLAWVRTALGSLTVGVAIAHLLPDTALNTYTGLFFVIQACVIFLYGLFRSKISLECLGKNSFPVDLIGPVILTFFGLTGVGLSIATLFAK